MFFEIFILFINTKDVVNGKNKFISVGVTSYGDGCGRPFLPG